MTLAIIQRSKTADRPFFPSIAEMADRLRCPESQSLRAHRRRALACRLLPPTGAQRRPRMHHALRVTKRTAAGWLFFLASTGCGGLSLAQPTEPRPASPDVAPAAPPKTAKHSLSRYPDTMPASAPDPSTPPAASASSGAGGTGGITGPSGNSAAAGPGGPADMRGEPAHKQPLR